MRPGSLALILLSLLWRRKYCSITPQALRSDVSHSLRLTLLVSPSYSRAPTPVHPGHTQRHRQTWVWLQGLFNLSRCFLLGGGGQESSRLSFLDAVVLSVTTICTRIIRSSHGFTGGPLASAFTVGAEGQLGRVSGGKVGSQGHQSSRICAQAQPHGKDPQQEGTAGSGPCPFDVPLGPSLVGL